MYISACVTFAGVPAELGSELTRSPSLVVSPQKAILLVDQVRVVLPPVKTREGVALSDEILPLGARHIPAEHPFEHSCTAPQLSTTLPSIEQLVVPLGVHALHAPPEHP
ncbi:MAG TPA: hypothetical protein VIJ88_02420 [Candidatus Paceibacterota bacterium]